MDEMTYDHTDDWAVHSEGSARVFGYVEPSVDPALEIDTVSADEQVWVQGAYRVLGYRAADGPTSVVSPILNISKGCEVQGCVEGAVTYVPICTQPCRCREWLCGAHAGQLS